MTCENCRSLPDQWEYLEHPQGSHLSKGQTGNLFREPSPGQYPPEDCGWHGICTRVHTESRGRPMQILRSA
jgi:hypothetical protein